MSFGQNEWLVDEMFQQFKKDPQSVDQEWRDYFTKNASATDASPGNSIKSSARGAAQDAAPMAKRAAATEAEAKETGRRPSKGPEPTRTPNKKIPQQAKKSPMDKADNAESPESGETALRGVAKAIATATINGRDSTSSGVRTGETVVLTPAPAAGFAHVGESDHFWSFRPT